MKIAINGCGVAGPTLAWWLKKYGHHPVLFEKAPTLREGGYVIDFWGTGYDIADRMGIIPTLKADAYFIKHIREVTSCGWTTSNMSSKVFHDLTEGRYLSIARSDLARHVFDVCKGVETRFGTSVIGIENAKDSISVNLSDGGREAYDLVIGADGLHSKIRELTFGPQDQFEKHVGFYVAAFVLSGYRPRDELTYISHTRPGRQISRVSLRNDQTLFLFVFSGDRLDREPMDESDKKSSSRKYTRGWDGKRTRYCSVCLMLGTSISTGSARSECRAGRAAGWPSSATPRLAHHCLPAKGRDWQ